MWNASLFAQTCTPATIYANETTSAVCFEVASNVRNCYSNNMPDHTDDYSSPFTILAGDYEYSMCAYPVPNSTFTPLYEETLTSMGCTDTYAFGVATNGVKLDPNSAETFEDTLTGAANIDWHTEASYIFAMNMGSNGGHLNPFGEYHYHDVPAAYYDSTLGIDGSGHSSIVGWAADGFPIYYKYVYTDALDSTSGIAGLSSGYSLKSGMRPGDGESAPDGSYTGLYVEDYEYSTTDLDSCNGRFGITPDFPDGTYYYVLTDNFPYIPRCFKGTFVDHTFRVGPGAACPASTASTDCAASQPVYGCMDPFACNYDASATADLGSCSYTGPDTSVTVSGNTLTAVESGATYQWYNCTMGVPIPMATSQSFTAMMTGEFALIINDGGCADTSACYSFLITEQPNDIFLNRLNVFPNPTTDKVHVELGASYAAVKIEVLDVMGKILSTHEAAQIDQFSLPLGDAPGIYFVRVKADEFVGVVKVIHQ